MKRMIVMALGVLSVAGSQTLRWAYRHGSLAGIARAVVCAPDSNIYAAGTSYDTLFLPQMTVVGLTQTGGQRWDYRRLGMIAWPSQPDFVRNPLACGTDGNLYVAGAAIDTAGSMLEKYDFTVFSLTAQGQERWVYNYGGPIDSGGFAQAVTRGSDGNVYAAGWCRASGGDMDLTVVGLTPAGQERWVYRYPNPGGSFEMAIGVACGADGNVYAAGIVGQDTAPRFTVVSLNPGGTVRWVYIYDQPGTTRGYAMALTPRADGDICAAGCVEGAGGDADIAVVCLTQTGTERWTYVYNGPDGADDIAYSLARAGDGTVYASGFSADSGGLYDIAVVSLTSSGGERWVYRYRTDYAQMIDYPLALGADGNVYAGGTTYADSTEEDLAVVSLTTSGGERWVYRYNGPDNGSDAAMSLAFGADGNIYAAGFSGFQFIVISLDPALGIEEKPSVVVREARAPTLVRDVLWFSSAPDPRPRASDCLLDIGGRKVADLEPGANDVSHLASGVYFVRSEPSAASREPSAVTKVILSR